MKNFSVDLVILNERGASYVQDLQTRHRSAGAHQQGAAAGGGGRHRQRLRRARRPDDGGDAGAAACRWRAPCWSASAAASRISSTGCRRSSARGVRSASAPVRQAMRRQRRRRPALPELEFFNGLGGFADDGREYVVVLPPGRSTPAPWINVIANPGFGFQVAAEGGGFTWSVISRENQLTPWSNDPVSDRSGEAIYLRDEDSGEVWSATANPIRLRRSHLCRPPWPRLQPVRAHRTRHRRRPDAVRADRTTRSRSRGCASRNHSGRAAHAVGHQLRRMGARHLAQRQRAPFIVTARDEPTGALLARNPWSPAFADARRLLRSRRHARRSGRPTAANSSAAMARSTAPAALAMAARAVGQGRSRRSIPAARCGPRSRCRRAKRSRSSRCSARRPASRRRARSSPSTAPPTSMRCCRRCTNNGAQVLERVQVAPPTAPWTSC